MAKQLCKSHVTLLAKVRDALALRQNMYSVQLIVGHENRKKMEEAEKLICDAINLLQNIS